MPTDELSRYLQSLEREDHYRLDCVVKESPYEITQCVYLRADDGSEQGPFIRKLISRDSQLGSAYERLFAAYQSGQHFTHIPRLFECYNSDDATVVVMEYIEGPTLADVVYESNPSVQLAAQLFGGICDAVHELHTQFDPPIIHRDLKPSNIIIRNNIPVIIDFGIAREYNTEAETDTTIFGTRAYAPPEQFGYGQTTTRSDVYALGMLLYFMLVEKTPTSKIVQNGFVDPGIPDALRQVIVHATAFDPQKRYGSAAELKKAFASALMHQRVPAPVPDHNQEVEQAARVVVATMNQTAQPSAPPAPLESEQHINAQQAPNSISPTQGRARNRAIAVFYLLLVGNSIYDAFVTPERYADYPTVYRWYFALVAMPITLTILAYLAMNKQRLRTLFPVLKNFTGAKEKLTLIALFFIVCLGLVIVGNLTGYSSTP